jgi:hypothetical protein
MGGASDDNRCLPGFIPEQRGSRPLARTALEAYQRETGFFDEPAERLLRYLIADLGHLAGEEGVSFLPIVTHAEAYCLQESASAKERPKLKA